VAEFEGPQLARVSATGVRPEGPSNVGKSAPTAIMSLMRPTGPRNLSVSPYKVNGRRHAVGPEGECKQGRHQARCVSPTLKAGGLAREVANLLWPWNVHEFPGKRAMLAAVGGVKPSTAKHWLRGRDPLPLHASQRLEAFLRAKAAEAVALAEALREHGKLREPIVSRQRGCVVRKCR
jgi:hypothetical protein